VCERFNFDKREPFIADVNKEVEQVSVPK
jgi:hypothetical protein